MENTMGINKRIAVLGAGISGLASAWYLHKLAPECKLDVYEARDRVGGVIRTIESDHFQIEQGVDNFITTVPWGLDLCRDLDLISDVVPTNNRYRRTFVVRKKKLYPLPDGFLMMAPTRLVPLALTPLLSPFGKLRAGLELFLPRRPVDRDESMSEFVIRRLGREVYDRIVEPLVSGIYAGDARKLSVWATLPRFPEMEVQHRSLILAMRSQLKQARTIKREEQSGARYSFFVSLKSGLDTLPRTIADKLPPGSIHLNRKMIKIDHLENGSWSLTDQEGRSEIHDAIITALPAPANADLFAESIPELGDLYRKIELSGVAIITLAFKNEQIQKPMKGMGFVVPEQEHSPIVAGSFSSHKYPHRAPEGSTMIRLFTGGARMPDFLRLSDSEMLPIILKELGSLLSIQGDPELVDIARWDRTMPQYNKGHLQWLDDLHALEDRFPSLGLAGNALDGVGIPNCIKNGKEAAEKILRAFSPAQKETR
ncbi:MAG: protoporphyrinogen oxidase [Planctomycetia bacterium]|nr:protoporphyrinogen oxidase [Planctomycetia bacterium]